MKNLTTLFALSALALTACSEGGTNQNTAQDTPQQQDPVENPFVTTATDTDQPSEDSPVSNPPITEPEVDQPPVIQPPVSAPEIDESPQIQPEPPTENLNSGDFLNGSSADSASSIWVCNDSGLASAEEVSILAFFGDGDGIVGDAETFELISWTTNGAYIELYFEGQYIGQLDNVSASVSAGTLDASYVLVNGASGVLDCQLVDLDDSVGIGDMEGDTFDDSSTTDTGGTGSTSSGTLINDISGDNLNTAWACELGDGSQIGVFFLAQGAGGLVSNEYPDGISMTWTNSSQGVSMSLSDGNQLTFSAPQFSGDDFFQVENVNIQGMNVAGMDCQLMDL